MVFKVLDVFELEFVITEKEYNNFLALSNDYNPLHTNKEFAKEKGFPDRVMHGNILNCFLSYFVGESLPIKNVIIHSQEINYKNPMFLNDKLNFSAKVTGIYESVNAVEFKFFFKNLSGITVAKGKIQIGVFL